ncbi:MAG TPA: hypothetical protein VN688_01020 [Gemmataceae bacterium]|nr:hypothetical protein [Gemmataceae bacterium]
MAADTDRSDRTELAVQLARLFGFDLSILEGMTLEQLRHVAKVSAERMQSHPDDAGVQEPDEALRALGYDVPAPTKKDEMDFSEKTTRAVAYFDRHRPALVSLGYSRSNFAEVFGRAPSRVVRRLR